MADLLRLGAGSLQNWQSALNTTGHNIANANTEGYSRQTVELGTARALRFGFGYVGQGAEIVSIERASNSFVTSQVRNFTSSASQYETFVQFSSRVDDILANSQNSLSVSMERFFNAASDVAASPSTLPERQALIGEGDNLVARQQSFNALLQDLNSEINNAIGLRVTEINGIASSISEINQLILNTNNSGGTPNDLLDQRDRLVVQLSTKISTSVIEQNDGSFNVLIGKGQALVIGAVPTELEVRFNQFDSSRLEIGIKGLIGNDSSQFVKGGELQGLLDFRSRVLNPAQTQLGVLALGMGETINAQHKVGVDLNGVLGGNIFAPIAISVAPEGFNAGTSGPVVTLTDASEVRASDYSLDYNGTQWQLTRLSDSTSVSGAGPLVLDGMSVDVSAGVPVSGDSFRINPGHDAAVNFAMAISDPRKIAAASPVIADTPLANVGIGILTDLKVAANNTLPLAAPISLTFNANAGGAGISGFDVVGGPGGSILYDPATDGAGKAFTFATQGVSFTLANTPQPGDSFTITNNTGAFGDNRNIVQIGELQYASTLNGGKNSYQEFYGGLVAQVGVISNQAGSNLTIENSLLNQATDYRDSISGVNLDEEAANLLRYQQAYQASAQMIKIADQLFQTLINSIR
jgi:flagellar hook-associated protein 1 FlgK